MSKNNYIKPCPICATEVVLVCDEDALNYNYYMSCENSHVFGFMSVHVYTNLGTIDILSEILISNFNDFNDDYKELYNEIS